MPQEKELKMSSYRFRKEREASWVDLDSLLDKMENKGLSTLTEAELLRLPMLYSLTISSLSVARSILLDKSLLDYLDNLAKRAYLACYSEKMRFKDLALRFVYRDIPVSLWQIRGKFLLGLLILMTGYWAGRFQFIYADFSSYFSAATLNYINLTVPSFSGDFVFVFIGVMSAFFLLFGICYSIPAFLFLLLQGFLLSLPASHPDTVWLAYFPAIFSILVMAGSCFDITSSILFRQRFSLHYDLPAIAGQPVLLNVFSILCFLLNYIWIKIWGPGYLSEGIAVAGWVLYALRGKKLINQKNKDL